MSQYRQEPKGVQRKRKSTALA